MRLLFATLCRYRTRNHSASILAMITYRVRYLWALRHVRISAYLTVVGLAIVAAYWMLA